ncbi:MAG: hypothetical protein MIL41_04815 [Hyphomicrobiales bacterium]|jgi:hypothetical protein
MSDTIRTYGTVNEYTLALIRQSAPGVPGGVNTRLNLYLTQGADQRYVSDFPDNGAGIASANAVATGILTAAAITGGTVALGA